MINISPLFIVARHFAQQLLCVLLLSLGHERQSSQLGLGDEHHGRFLETPWDRSIYAMLQANIYTFDLSAQGGENAVFSLP